MKIDKTDRNVILCGLQIDEISAVDEPAQEGAKITMLKRKNTENDKGTDMETKDTGNIDSKVNIKKSMAKLSAELGRLKNVVALNPKERIFFEDLVEDEQASFLGAKSDVRMAKMDAVSHKAKVNDPIVYTTLDGLKLYKSAGDVLIQMAKVNDDLKTRLDDAEAVLDREKLEKRANIELAHMPGTVRERAALLKAVDSMADPLKEGAMKILVAQNKNMQRAYKTFGVSISPSDDDSSVDKMDKMAKALMDKNPGMTIEKAGAQVLLTPEGSDLYSQTCN